VNPLRADRETLRDMLAKADQKMVSARMSLGAGHHDDAASRAYYAAFHALSAVLAGRGLFYSSHGQTLGAFNREIVKTGMLPPEAFTKVQRLFQDRHTGDYDVSRSLDEDTGRRAVEDAAWLVAECRRLIDTQ
jgi:uncharacterized protein (UPF0332 family)